MRTAIIGGGAAGLCAAVAAAEKGGRVTVFERMDRVGKKLLATGNGRCNVMNMGPFCYPAGADFAARALSVFSAFDLQQFFEKHGLMLREEAQGRVYPATGQAATVLNVLLRAMDKNGVRVVLNAPVDRIEKIGEMYRVLGEAFEKVIVAGGGRAQEKLGSNGSAVKLLQALGHPVTKLAPALCPIEADMTHLKGLSGLRVRADVSIEKDGRTLHRESGELLFTDYGLSGVCVMQLSRFFEPGCRMHIDLRKAMGFEGDTLKFFQKRRETLAHADAADFLTGLFATPLCVKIQKRAQLFDLSDAALVRLAQAVCDYTVDLRAIRGFDQAQVTRGGAEVKYFIPETMASTLHKGLYAAGEVLDVDGLCGGFNLMFAFCSGIIAARAE